jgi:hypothetical protein
VSGKDDIVEIQFLGPFVYLAAPHLFVDVGAQNNMVSKSLTCADGFCQVQQKLGPGFFAAGAQVSSVLGVNCVDSCAGVFEGSTSFAIQNNCKLCKFLCIVEHPLLSLLCNVTATSLQRHCHVNRVECSSAAWNIPVPHRSCHNGILNPKVTQSTSITV